MRVLAEISPLDPATGTRTTLYVASAEDRNITGLNGRQWWPAMTALPTQEIELFDGDFSSEISLGQASIALNEGILERGDPNIRRKLLAGAGVTLYAGESGDAWPWPIVFKGVGTSFEREANALKLTAKVDTSPFDANVLTATYAGTGGAEGGADLKGKPKPLIFGRALNVEPVLINADYSVFQFSAYGAIQGVSALYERASAFSASVGDFANYSALVAATIAPGQWATCLAQGLVRLGAPPYGVITGDVDGDKSSGTWLRKTGEIINWASAIAGVSAGAIDSASLAALDVAVPRNINVVLTEQITVLELAQRLARPCNAQAGVSWLGKLFVVRVGIGTPTITLNAQGRALPPVKKCTEADVSPPYSRMEMEAKRSWRVHSLDEIATSAPLVDRGNYDASTTYRAGNIVTMSDGSRWQFVGATPLAGSTPSDANANWERLTDATAASTALGVNQIVNSEFVAGLKGHVAGWDGDAGLPVTRGLNLTGWWGILNVAYVMVLGTPAVGEVFDGYRSLGTDDLAGMRRWGLVVDPGDRLYFSMLMASHRCDCRANVAFYDAAGAYVGEDAGDIVPAGDPGASYDFGGGDPANARVSAAFATAPAGARYALLFPRAISTGQVNPYLFWSREFLSRVDPAQTIPPIYGPGPADRAADATGENTALDTFNVNGVPASTLITTVNNIGSDSVLSRGEKPSAVLQWTDLYTNWTALDAKAGALGIAGSERSAANAAMTALASYLVSISPNWGDSSVDSPISASTWNTLWSNAYTTVATLQAAIQGQPGADGLTIPPIANIDVSCYSDGTPKTGEFNKVAQVKVFKGSTDVTEACSFSKSDSNTSSSVSNSSGSRGLVTFTSISADTGYTDVSITYGSLTATVRIPIAKRKDAASSSPTYPAVSINFGTTNYPTQVALASGQTLSLRGVLRVQTSPSFAGTFTLQLQASLAGSGSWGVLTSGSGTQNYGPDGPATVSLTGTITNSSGAEQVYSLRAVATYTDSGPNADTTRSYMRPQ